jgi:Ser/Thr protein kinase RdoA (MazF antagonist)
MFDPAWLAAQVAQRYPVGVVSRCHLVQHNLRDTYRLATGTGAYVLRVGYRRAPTDPLYRDRAALLWELELLARLAATGLVVETPTCQHDGDAVLVLPSPEGERYAALTMLLPGDELRAPDQTPERAHRYAAALAELHCAFADAAPADADGAVPVLNAERMLDRPLAAAEPLFARRRAQWLRVCQLADSVRVLVDGPAVGRVLCHGDTTGGNAVLSPAGTVAFFDFENAGWGPAGFDVAVFRWGLAVGQHRLGWPDRRVAELWAAFRDGYAMPLPDVAGLLVVRQLWYLGLEAAYQDDWGTDAGTDAFVDRELALLERLASGLDRLSPLP